MLRWQQEHKRNLKLLAPTPLANVKLSLTLARIPQSLAPKAYLPKVLEPFKHVWFSTNIRKHAKMQEKKSEDTEQVSELDLNVTQMLELSDRVFKVTMIDILRALMEITENIQSKGNTSRERETKKESEKHSRNYKHCNRLKNVLDRLISSPGIAKDSTSELEDKSTETS